MTLVDELLVWSESGTQPMWQRDALRRLFQSDRLSECELDDLYRLLKIEHGLDVPLEPPAEPMTAEHIPGGTPGASVQILALNNLSNVNAFPDGRALPFAPAGLTAIYGANGSGKSGYARVLKQVCRARYREPVRPNAFAANHAERTPTADVVMSVNGAERTYRWNPTSARDADLSTVTVFDAGCAADYIANEGETAFQPFGLSKIERLATEVIPALTDRLNSDLRTITVDITPFHGLIGSGNTAVGRFIQNLTKDSDPAEATSLGTVLPEEAARSVEIARALAEANPEPRALALDRLAARLDSIIPIASSVRGFTTDRAIERLQGLVRAHADSEQVRENAERALRGENMLPGTGNHVWKELFAAAKAFSMQSAYSEHPFPHVGDIARCVLCQTELDADAKIRMQQFSDFVTSNAATEAESAKAALNEALQKIRQANVTLGIDETLLAEIGENDETLKDTILQTRDAWQARHQWMLNAATHNQWEGCPTAYDSQDMDAVLSEKSDGFRTAARTLRQAVDQARRVELTLELEELKARQALVALLPAVKRYIENSIEVAKLEQCRTQLATRPISTKAGGLAQTYISDALITTMKEELRAIGFRRSVKHQVDRRTEVGRTLLRISLEGSFMPTQNVLSEAEQRASALAFFLAELRQSGSKSTLVLDDPVSSMDHVHREKIAERIVAEAKKRQVIVLTHDSVFLTILQQVAKAADCLVDLKALEWDSYGPGALMSELPWDHMNVGQRFNALDEARSDLESTWGEYPSEAIKKKMAETYGMLRGTIERLIRDDILNKVVKPFSERVAVEDLGAVVGFAMEDWNALLPIYDRACGALRGHDTTTEGQFELPDPTQLKADMDVLKGIKANAATRKKTAAVTREQRKG